MYPRGDSNPHSPITLTHLRREAGYSGMCLNCGTATPNPRFCSRSCAASFNNKRPDVRRRTLEGLCATCATPIRASRKYCAQHKRLDKTLNSNAGSNAEVRDRARRVYRNSGRPWSCALCSYDVHVDICHVKDIRSYPHGTPYSVINDQANLIALCRNHHWEFDHDLL